LIQTDAETVRKGSKRTEAKRTFWEEREKLYSWVGEKSVSYRQFPLDLLIGIE
jgi:hypothetical protein